MGLYEIEEMEEDDDIEDYFTMDIHFWDFVQYINSHKFHIWKKVINKLINNKKSKINKFQRNRISEIIKQTLIDYGRNGLGNVNMEIYETQIKEYTNHLTKLFNEYVKSQKSSNKKKSNFVTKK